MATLIAVYKSDGRCIGRCDAKCYNASEPNCHCICGGANHGAGLKQAQENTERSFEEWIENWKEENPYQDTRFEVPRWQKALF